MASNLYLNLQIKTGCSFEIFELRGDRYSNGFFGNGQMAIYGDVTIMRSKTNNFHDICFGSQDTWKWNGLNFGNQAIWRWNKNKSSYNISQLKR